MGDVWGFCGISSCSVHVYLHSSACERACALSLWIEPREKIGSPVYYILYAELRFGEFDSGIRVN